MKTITAYKCDHCGKVYQLKHAAGIHETRCIKNPKNNRACLSCIHLHKKGATIFYDYADASEQERHLDLFHCEKVDSYLYPPSVEHKGNQFELGDDDNGPMKTECSLFKDVNTEDVFEGWGHMD